MRVLCLGWYNKDNIGDESYKLSFPIIFPQYSWTFTDFPSKQQINDCDFIVLGGGNILERNFLSLLKDINKPIYAFSVGTTEKLTEQELSIFTKIYSRDKKAQNWVPDAAFALTPDKHNGKILVKNLFAKKDLYEKLFIVVTNAHLVKKQEELSREFITFHNFCFKMAQIIDNTNASFLFLPFSTSSEVDDRTTNSWLASRCKFHKKNIVVYDKFKVQETLDIISVADLVISMRLHSSIFACLAGVRFLDIVHHDKSRNFLETIGKKEYLDYWDFSNEKAKNLISDYQQIEIPIGTSYLQNYYKNEKINL